MKIEFREGPVERIETPVLVTDSFEENPASSGTTEQLPATTRKMLEGLQASGELTGKAHECTLIHNPPGLAASRLLVVGAGKREKFLPPHLARLSGAAVRYARSKNIHEISWVTLARFRTPEAVQHLVQGAIMADYDADKYRADKNSGRRVDRFTLLAGETPFGEAERKAIEQGRIVAESANFTRDLVNEPSNIMTPT
ncbi:MAG TPA: M17 family peptidase N-terminal domain-containing protein, partial [Terriglobia bacterium]|nr:M17 family peptidase N-terminal domain-containing protein [Terriglobia bacterium]